MLKRLAAAACACAGLLGWGQQAHAVPAFAAQTGQACAACHIGAYGPQLTPLGRAFKIGGYTQSGGEGLRSQIPLSAMVIGSVSHTAKSIPREQVTPHYSTNNNYAFDQVSIFVAGRLSDYNGGFMQLTYEPIGNVYSVDNTDLRPFTTAFDIGDKELRVGFTVNNNPTVQDPFNTTFAWGYPYVGSAFAPTPAASPILAGAFAGNTFGYTAYAWWDKSLYLEAGAYTTQSRWAMARLGSAFGPGSSHGLMPYLRAAYEWNWNRQSAHVGAMFMQSDVNPATAERSSDGSNGRDKFTDYAFDGSYSYLGDGTHIVTVQGIYTHESQNLGGTTAAFNAANETSFGSRYALNDVRINVSYWYQNTYGVTLGWQKTWGPANPVLFAPDQLGGSNNSKPNSNAFIAEVDWVPFGKADSWMQPYANLKLGVQYIAYTQFNGSSSNYDGSGRSAGANNTLFAFAWLAF